MDRLLGVLMQLAGEVYILRDRQRALEELLEEHGIAEPGAIDRTTPSIDGKQRDRFVQRLLEPVIQAGRSSSRVDDAYQIR
jgi:hypothetical protein